MTLLILSPLGALDRRRLGLLKRRPWARILMIVLSMLHLINIPFGTMLDIYGLWVLLTRETEQLFAFP